MASKLNQWIVREYGELLRDREGVVLLNLDSLSVGESQALRGAVRSAGARLQVTRKRLVRVALHEAGIPIDLDAESGTLAFLVGDVESTLAASKAIEKLWEKVKAPERKVRFRAAFLDGSAMGPEEAARIPAMPDRQTLRGQLCAAIAGPGRMLATILNELPASTARALQARADQGEAA